MVTRKELEALLAVCQSGSFMGAASLLGCSQGNVSKMISGLENKLGVQLFARIYDGVVITADGEYVKTYAEEIKNLFKELETFAEVCRGGR